MSVLTNAGSKSKKGRKCVNCGAVFFKSAYWQKYCSPKCRMDNFYRRKYDPTYKGKADETAENDQG